MLNVDSRYDVVIGHFSVGAVTRDHDGIVRAASSCGIRCPGFVLSAELYAILHGIKFAVHEGFVNVLIYSDSSIFVQEVTSNLKNRDHDGILIARFLLCSACPTSLRFLMLSDPQTI